MVDLASAKTVVKDLVHWENPVGSASTLGFVLAVLVSICYYSFISVVAYISLTLLVIVLGIKIYSFAMVFLKKVFKTDIDTISLWTFGKSKQRGRRELSKADPSSDPLIAITNIEVNIPPEKVAEITGFLVDVANPSIMELRRLFLLENWFDSLKFVLCLWGFTYIGSWFNMMTLVILSWVGLFTLPLLYKNNQASVDEIVGSVNTQMNEIKDKVMSVIPMNKDSAKKEE